MAGTAASELPETSAELAAAAARADREAAELEAAMVSGDAEADIDVIDAKRADGRRLGLLARRRRNAEAKARAAQRKAELERLGADIRAAGLRMDADALRAAITERDASAAKVTGIITAHNDDVSSLRGRAVALDVRAVGPGGPRASDSHVATVDTARHGGVQAGPVQLPWCAGEREYLAAAAAVRRPVARPGSLYISRRSGAVIDRSESETPASFRQQLQDGQLVRVDDLIDDFMAGRFEMPGDLEYRAHVQVQALQADRAAARAAQA